MTDTRTDTAVSITQVYTVPDEHILTLIEMAGYGCNYWAESGVIDAKARTYTVTPDLEARTNDPAMVARTLKFEWIAKRLVQLGVGSPLLRGIALDGDVAGYARKYLAALSDPATASNADCEIDSDLADVVIQLAFFDGEVVFG